jgi:hypothetical protein
MICEDDENVSEPEMVSHEDVQPDKKDVAPEVTSQKAATSETTPQNVTPAAASETASPKPETEKLAEDLSQARLSDKKEEEEEVKVVKRNDVVTPASVAAPSNAVTSPPSTVVSPTSKASTDDDDDRPQPPDDDSVPDEDSLVKIYQNLDFISCDTYSCHWSQCSISNANSFSIIFYLK